MFLLALFFFCSIFFSFLCSVLEAALLSIPPSYVTRLVQQNDPLGIRLQRFKDNIDRPLSAILTLNTIAHTVGAIGVGAQAGELWANNAMAIGPIAISFESIVASAMTLAILVFSEIIPKTIGANLWQPLAGFTARTLELLVFVLAPFVWLSELITKRLKKNKSASVFSRENLSAMAEAGEQAGTLDPAESRIIKNLFRLRQLTVRNVMTPRTVVISVDETTSLADFEKALRGVHYSRIPIFESKADHVTGFVLKDDILQRIVEGKDPTQQVRELKKPIPMVGETKKLSELFEFLVKKHAHIATVVDEFGGFSGLVTMEDLFETLLGLEIMDEGDSIEDLQALARQRWKERTKQLKASEEA